MVDFVYENGCPYRMLASTFKLLKFLLQLKFGGKHTLAFYLKQLLQQNMGLELWIKWVLWAWASVCAFHVLSDDDPP